MGEGGDSAAARGELIFLYGTLRRGGAPWRRLGLERRLTPAGRGTVAGALHDLGEYPGLVLDGRGRVRGEVCRIADPGVIAVLDRYEGFDPADPGSALFRRARAALLGRSETAWVYEYARPLRGAPVIACGEWRRPALRLLR